MHGWLSRFSAIGFDRQNDSEEQNHDDHGKGNRCRNVIPLKNDHLDTNKSQNHRESLFEISEAGMGIG